MYPKGAGRVTLLLLLLILGNGCQLSPPPQVLPWENPPGFPPMVIPENNPFTKAGIELGRRLFYDPVLSADSTISCASCHLQERAFTDGQAQSRGIAQRKGTRSAMSLANVGYYYTGLFWDGRTGSLEEQALHPVRNFKEMGFSWNEVEARLEKQPRYVRWFREAFGIRRATEIDSGYVARALAQFQRTLVSKDAKFDRVMRQEETFTPAEKRGWTIFFDASPDRAVSECNHCHVDPLFTNLAYENNGIQSVNSLEGFADPGLGAVHANRFDNGKFRVPTLRNIELTAPYMHDGRFQTLDQVLEHYISGGHPAENLNPNVRRLYLSAQDKKDILSFLYTLTDSVFICNKAFENPWKP